MSKFFFERSIMLTKFDEGWYQGTIETLGSNKVCTSVKGWLNSED